METQVQAMRNECERHESTVRTNVSATDLKSVQRLATQVEETKEKREEARRELKQMIFKVINQLSSRQRVTMNKTFTLRDGKLWRFNRSNEINLRDIVEQKHVFEDADEIDTDTKAWRTIINQINNLDVKQRSSYRVEKEVKTVRSKDSPLVEDYSKVEYSSRNSDRLAVKKSGSYRGKGFKLHYDKCENPEDYWSDDLMRLKLLVAFKPEIEDVLEEAKQTYETQLKRRNDAKHKIRKVASKQLVAASI